MAIASRSLQCLRHLEHLAEEAQHSDGESALPASAVGDELGRFKIWAGNIGALQRDSRSLDYRLRDASQVGDQVMKVLQDLELSLHECIEIVSGQRAQKQGDLFDGEAFNDEFSDISDSDGSEDPSSSASEEEPVSELSHLFLAITEAITSLYKLSITIRNPTPRDRYAKAASSTPFDASYDVGHVYEKFPHVRSKAWLMDKLGRAITRRREFLRYREKHREKIGGNVRPSTDLTEHHELAISRKNLTYNDAQTSTGAPVIGYEPHSVSHSQFASTKATTYVANLNDESLDMRSTAGRSETSYVTSVAEDNSENTMQIPDPPKESANGMPFECPYCFTIQSVRNAKHWRKHLLSDLKPYICTFEDCSAQMFDRRHMWFQHEMDKHRKQWRCRFCSYELFGSAASLESHLQDQHSEYTKQQVLSLVTLCAQMPEHVAASACPFCDWDADLREQAVSKENETERAPSESNIFAVSLEQFQRHLGDHLEQLALFAIPPPMKELSGAFSNQAAASHNSNHTPDSSVVSEVSSLSSALTDHGFPPELYAAVMSGNIGRVTLELRNGADLTLQYGEFGSVLQAAAASLSWPSRDEILRILVENGADANMQGGVYGNALQAVAADPSMSGRRLLALGMLLDHGAEVNAVGGRYGHALIAAAAMPTPLSQMQHEPTSMVLKLLLDHGANPNARGSKSCGSALHQAIEHDDYESVQLLLDRGASTTVRHEDYGTPVHYAMKHAYGPVWQLLRRAALETSIERHYDKVRLRAALKIQRNFRHRQNSGDRALSSQLSQRKTSVLRSIENILIENEFNDLQLGKAQETVAWEAFASTRTSLKLLTENLMKVRKQLEDDDKECQVLQPILQDCMERVRELGQFLWTPRAGLGSTSNLLLLKLEPAQAAQLVEMKLRIQKVTSLLAQYATTSKAAFGLLLEGDGRPPVPPPRPVADVSKLTIPPQLMAVALFDFKPENINELRLHEGQVISVLQMFGAERGQDDIRAKIKEEAKFQMGVGNMLEALMQRKARKTSDPRLKLESELSTSNRKLLYLNSQLQDNLAQSACQMAEGWFLGQYIETGRDGFIPKNYVRIIDSRKGLDNEQSESHNRSTGDFTPIQDAPQPTEHKALDEEEDYCPICHTSFALITDGSDDVRESHIITCIDSRMLNIKLRKGILKASQPQTSRGNIDQGEGAVKSDSPGRPATQTKGKTAEGRLGRLWSTVNPSARMRKQGLQLDNSTGLLLEDHAVALFNFKGTRSDDLSFRKGKTITITERTESTRDWWTGKIGSRTGNLPGNFVEVLPPGLKGADLVQGQSTPGSTVGVRFSNEVGIMAFSGVEQPSTLYYGVPLEELCQREKGPVPKLITDCIEAVEFHGMGLIEVYGNFHIDWNENLTDELKAEYDQHPESLSLQQQIRIPNNIEYVTHLLKNFIWQLPGLLIPRESLASFVRAAQFVARQRIDHFGYEKGEGQATTELQATIRSLPQVNRNVFEFLILHFKRVTDRAYQNTMTSDKLAVALAPSFKGGVDSGAGPKLPLADLSWALEYIIRRGDFWFRDLEKPWGVFE